MDPSTDLRRGVGGAGEDSVGRVLQTKKRKQARAVLAAHHARHVTEK